MHGFLNIDKPAGMTSHDVVARVRRITGERRVGHAGTLDPAATGVLVVALGAATRLIEYVQEQTAKRYLATVALGATTTTDDAEGELLAEAPVPALTETELREVLARFEGEILQVPPMYSALHHQGQRLHKLARAGKTVELEPRPVWIERVTLLGWEPPQLTIDVICGKGTYIRALARDVGQMLGCGAHLAALQRTAVGSFRLEDSVPIDQHSPEEISAIFADHLLPPEVAVADWLRVGLSAEQARLVRNGMAIDLPGVMVERVRAHTPDGALLALLAPQQGRWRPEKVFDWT
jgi:tRNA pseudouridine55 synthase